SSDLVSLGRQRTSSLVTSLKEGGRGASGAWRHYARRGLVIAQVAFAVMLVIGAGLLVQTVYNLTRIDAGFDRSRLVTFSMTLPIDRKSTRLNSSHVSISYAVFCLKKKMQELFSVNLLHSVSLYIFFSL